MNKINNFISTADSLIETYKQEHEIEILEEHEIENIILPVKLLFNLNEEEFVQAKNALHARMAVKMNRGVCLKGDYNHKPWYSAYKTTKEIFPFWQRYVEYLIKDKKFSHKVINALDESTDDIMDMLANPEKKENFSRRGLIIGDVQSGKTATYIALINKAADAGYKVIILLTGTIEKLRQQTQGRIDEGFTGIKFKNYFNGIESKNIDSYIGVSKYSIIKDMYVTSLTSTELDFNRNAYRSIISSVRSLAGPVIFVIKKNKSILEKLKNWLLNYSAENNEIQETMLLIDDEADAASINTNNDDTNPTAINTAIRSLLKIFIRSNYVAFTATPYANIFINPDTTDDMLNDDLFPKDFIYSLNAPSNYIGASSIFVDYKDDDGKVIPAKYKYMLHNNDDCEDFIPERHRKDYLPEKLPESLKEALASFIIANAIRDLRGHHNTHRTMLINVSRYIYVQNNLTDIIKEYMKTIIEEIRNYSKMDNALKHSNIKYIKDVYDKYYAQLNEYVNAEQTFSWQQIQETLYKSSASIEISSVNGGNASKILDYENYEKGLRLIAVGGLSLSRGLTLEGLVISYFYRNSKMYDTLMQMGRWFGYRTGYEDLCQIWMTNRSQEWYSNIAEATDELRKDIVRMRNANRTPKDFGLQVRADNNSLLVTALNKMRSAQEYTITVSLSGLYKETPYITDNKEENNHNLKAVNTLIYSIINDKYIDEYGNTNMALPYKHQFLNIPKGKIIDFLSLFKASMFNLYTGFNDNNEQGFIVNLLQENHKPILDKWDILIASGEGEPCSIGGIETNKIQRNFTVIKSADGINGAFKMSGSKSRLGTSSDAKGGLKKDSAIKIKDNYKNTLPDESKNKSIPAKRYFEDSTITRNPLLIIYPVELKNNNDDIELNEIEKNYKNDTLIGIGIGIPVFNDTNTYQSSTYIVNMRKYKEYTGFDDNDIEIDEIENE